MNINTASDIVHSIVEDFNFEDWDFSVMVSRQFLILHVEGTVQDIKINTENM